MRIVTSIVAAMALASGLIVNAQPTKGQPVDCGMYIEVEQGEITSIEEGDTYKCQFGGRLVVFVNNMDTAKYTVLLDNFDYDGSSDAKAADCDETNTIANHPMPNSGKPSKKLFLSIAPNEVGEQNPRRKFKNKERPIECYKFNVTLFDDNGAELQFIDPDLEVSEPPPPPPIKPGQFLR